MDGGLLPGKGDVGDKGDVLDVGTPDRPVRVVGLAAGHARAGVRLGLVAQVEGALGGGHGHAGDGGQLAAGDLLALGLDPGLQLGEFQGLAGADPGCVLDGGPAGGDLHGELLFIGLARDGDGDDHRGLVGADALHGDGVVRLHPGDDAVLVVHHRDLDRAALGVSVEEEVRAQLDGFKGVLRHGDAVLCQTVAELDAADGDADGLGHPLGIVAGGDGDCSAVAGGLGDDRGLAAVLQLLHLHDVLLVGGPGDVEALGGVALGLQDGVELDAVPLPVGDGRLQLQGVGAVQRSLLQPVVANRAGERYVL